MFDLTRTARRRIAHGTSYLFLTTVGVTMVFPLVWMVLTSVKTPAEPVLDPAEWWPRIPWRLGKGDIRDWPALCRKIIRESRRPASPAARVWGLIDNGKARRTIRAVAEMPGLSTTRPSAHLPARMLMESDKSTILTALNKLLQNREFFNEKDFARLDLPKHAYRAWRSIRRFAFPVGLTNIRGPETFCRRLAEATRRADPTPARRLWYALPADLRGQLVQLLPAGDRIPDREEPPPVLTPNQRSALAAALNDLLDKPDLFIDTDPNGLNLSAKAATLLSRDPPRRSVLQTRRLNAMLLEASFPRHFVWPQYDGPVRLLNRLVLDALFPNQIVPTHRFHWENYRTVIVQTNFGRVLFNSVFVTITATFGLVFTSSLAAFAFARLNFTGRDKIFLSYLATMMIPGAVTMIPVFVLVRELRWVNTYYALIVPSMFSAYGTFMLRQFFMTIPRDLEEAALLDGCSIWGIYWHVVMPLSKPALAALTILTFMGQWRGFMWPLIVTHTRDMFTLPVALAAFQEMYGVRWTLMMAGAVIMIVPMLVVFVFGQRYFVEGIKLGALKG